jgi:hypothetical protein
MEQTKETIRTIKDRRGKTYQYLCCQLPVNLPETRKALEEIELLGITPTQFMMRVLYEHYRT